ncbi:ATP synthase F0, A subunit [Ehrlichia chaffeensis str. Heartland]|uniref:ATP synthase subunit a n=1 Tax=Ehrlichia chaffeensis (strain ATCC CRL-10679 / Arkansas) TaxID=205920 RepID=ATP6_EHRCR|nr:F0F1 ATP synthase subunit A [Ehrlichia chaffeensis]Q2GFB2.1 RecName: Full=ATP synthase subunit a; AltName: Full=ATP synthase F0 sector subunit a; AltName: Full=F-ATPase subunit 6 [Ehrlichia chaffeensis str. Arkansas]ABD45092.1 ATP synthase F0, A subunit [Ehrlichia chaffeensis str. Arkansas]AHX03266.1 ATP synthase F0, A subunit [Ehrlichia chaffeensis str. Heartland]AHX05183.1 ATP synthase F0, A subunit [Ehrlichia chaffeensis str. Jax]AHX06172.1 ATP synthase F0, A subunit [Ehrlichia chaffeens
MSANPLDQFKISTIFKLPSIGGYNIDFTNASLFMVLSTLIISLFCYIGLRKENILPNSMQLIIEAIYNFIVSTIESNVGRKGLQYIPLVFTIFTFIATCNLLGVLPLGFTVTSHIAVTFAISMVVFISVTAIGFKHQGIHFLRILLPKGTPGWLAPMMVFIELFAYCARPVSLSIRLAANMIAGHTIIKVIAGFVIKMNIFLTPLPMAFIIILIGFEIFVAILQAYIFTVLTCVYLSDAINEH